MILRTLSPIELAEIFEVHLTAAFPPAELKPLSSMEHLRREGVYDPLGAFDESGQFLGCALLWKHRDGRYLLLDYLCIPADKRNLGLGSRLIRALIDFYPDNVLIAEAEAPVGDPARDALIARRLDFYQRTGAVLMDYRCALFGVEYRNLCWGSPVPKETEVLKKHREIYWDDFGPDRFSRYIQLPLLPGEAVRTLTDWQED